MSNSPPPQPGSSQPTRQQLDDLDALLQRMLELPVNQLDEATPAGAAPAGPKPTAASPPAQTAGGAVLPEGLRPPVHCVVVETVGHGPTQDPPQQPGRPELRVVAPDELRTAPDEAADWVPLRSAWRPSAQTWPPLADSWRQANAQEEPAAATTGPTLALASPDSAATETDSEAGPGDGGGPAEAQAQAAAAPVGWGLRPLVALDRAFYGCLAVAGPPGRWLAGPAGRTLLGVLGLACLAGALALILVGR
jgi:hypothetical protein